MIEPTKSMGSPGAVGRRTIGSSEHMQSVLSGMIQMPFVPKMVPAPTSASPSGDHNAPCGKASPLERAVIWKRLETAPPFISATHKSLPSSTEGLTGPLAKARYSPSGDHDGQRGPLG